MWMYAFHSYRSLTTHFMNVYEGRCLPLRHMVQYVLFFLLLPGLDIGYVSIVKFMRYHLEIL